ncbi:MAG TPA: type II toxin-antitoxin system VapB family antitoxin [Solirubrobacteraceae bacterium]|nr:type II toxin-antitoxin system VapB family antitoxin [Solirubrobacteraceae bacterium]
MALNIKDQETDELVRELVEVTGETITAAVRAAVRERLDRLGAARGADRRFEDIMEISRRAATLPVLDSRTPDEIIGYDEHGLPA